MKNKRLEIVTCRLAGGGGGAGHGPECPPPPLDPGLLPLSQVEQLSVTGESMALGTDKPLRKSAKELWIS